ncbi:MAG: 3',5'-cyclic-AMP phosphodiesterase [Methylococcaceae bacterium]
MDAPLLILQITDLHILAEPGKTMAGVDTELYFSRVLQYAQKRHSSADLMLVTGDLVQNPSQQSYQRIYTELKKYQTRTLCLPGNHDDLTLMQQIINGKQINCNKNFKFKHWQIICLNSKKTGSQGGLLAADELIYLQNTLDKTPDLNTLIAVHHHPLPTHSAWMDTMMIENSDELFSILKQYSQVKAITCGHIHQELNTKKDNKLILGMPSTCFQFKPNCTDYTIDKLKPAYRTFSLHADGKINTQVHRVPFEIFNIERGPPLV